MEKILLTIKELFLFPDDVPYIRLDILDCSIALAHIGHGSSVTYKSQSSNRQDFNFLHAFWIAKISAWCVAIWLFSRLLYALAIILLFLTTTAPTGTSPFE